MPTFFDLNVHAYPETDVQAEDLLRVARRYGFAGIAITNHDLVVHEELKSPFIVRGVEIRAHSVLELKRKVTHYWGKVPLLAVHGGPDKLNRAAVEDARVDILAHPCGERGEGGLNHVSMRYAAENGVAIDFNVGALIHTRGGERARILSSMQEQLKLVRKYKAPMILTSNAYSIYDIRAPREMIALATLFGMSKDEATRALSEIPRGLLEKRWKREREVERL
ncbi:MAG: ribonuclease P protein component 3 [Methanophagales archaeon ANME-1-THS]|nr:MAG: ribonuclease P protein component 3 [Methanophagales archaeon ANME-1-THS]